MKKVKKNTPFAKMIKRTRVAAGMSIQDLAKAVKTQPHMIIAVEQQGFLLDTRLDNSFFDNFMVELEIEPEEYFKAYDLSKTGHEHDYMKAGEK